jgi:hypothetical protein
MTDGLGMLDQQRKRRSRQIPAPRNRPRSAPVSVLPVSDAEPSDSVPQSAKPISEEPALTHEAVEPTFKMSIYLDLTDDDFLENITHAGKISRPKVAVSRSAIVRLALERLADQMTATEIVAELRCRGNHQAGSGRKRR